MQIKVGDVREQHQPVRHTEGVYSGRSIAVMPTTRVALTVVAMTHPNFLKSARGQRPLKGASTRAFGACCKFGSSLSVSFKTYRASSRLPNFKQDIAR